MLVVHGAIFTGVKTEKNRKGRILGRFKGYLEGIFGDPSLTKIQGKTIQITENIRNTLEKTKKQLRSH